MRRVAVWFYLGLMVLAHPLSAAPPVHKTKVRRNMDLADTVDNTVILSKFAALVAASDLGTFLSSRGPFTLFVPTNSAFSKLPPGMFADLQRPENKEQLQRIVLFHLINGQNIDAKDLQKLKSLLSCEGSQIPLKVSRAGTQFVDKARLLRADQKCANGVLNQIDTLLMPPDLGVIVAGPPPATPSPANGGTPDTNSPSAADPDTTPVPTTDTTEKDAGVPAVPAKE